MVQRYHEFGNLSFSAKKNWVPRGSSIEQKINLPLQGTSPNILTKWKMTGCWFQIFLFFKFHPYLVGKWSNLTFACFSDGLVKNHQQTSDVMSSKGWDGSRRMKRASCFSAWRFLLRTKTPCATVLVGTLANGLFKLEVVLLDMFWYSTIWAFDGCTNNDMSGTLFRKTHDLVIWK